MVPDLNLHHYGVYETFNFTEWTVITNSTQSFSDIENWGHKVTVRDDGWFEDEKGRVLLLRGVNLGGASKMPLTPDGSTFLGIGKQWIKGHRNVSFVGRPFPLDEADHHLARLRAWGLTFVRFIITWEAIEHSGPGKYDVDYLEYVLEVVRKMRSHGISCFIDPHQDVWSRFTGGDGAPGWVLEAVGFDLDALEETGATITHQGHGDPLPKMIWGTNYQRLAAATMFTLFFAGDRFAPKTFVEDVPVQEYLQSHYLGALAAMARVLKDEPNVVGFDTLNEPSNGWIGRKAIDTNELPFRLGLVRINSLHLVTFASPISSCSVQY
jgi:hypothetical protein